MTLFASKLRTEEGLDEFDGDGLADDPGADAEDVHVVVLDPLVGGVVVVADAGADAGDLVGGDADADAAAADQNAAVGPTSNNDLANFAGEVGVVDGAVGVCPAVDDGMARRGDEGSDSVLEREAAVIAAESDVHGGRYDGCRFNAK